VDSQHQDPRLVIRRFLSQPDSNAQKKSITGTKRVDVASADPGSVAREE
jgi:hypothetical protein